MSSRQIQRRGLACAATLALAFLVGCGGASEAELVASAKSHLDKKDPKSAIIQLKTALQKNPQSPEVRYLLGDTLLRSGDAVSAILELEKAHDLKYDDDAVLPRLAQALMATGQAKKVTDLYGRVTLADPKAAADLKATVAAGYLAQRQVEQAQAAVDAALQFDPKNAPARLLNARLTAGRGAVDEALMLVQGVLADDARQRDAQNLKGELLWVGKGDTEGGIRAFREALAVDPRHLPAHSALITLLLQKRDVEGFKAQVGELKKVLPNHPQTRFFDTQLALSEGDLKRAREGAQQLLRIAPEDPRVLQLAGAVEFQGGALQLAEAHLNKALQQAPNLALARRLLAQTHLRSGQPGKALSALKPLLDSGRAGPEVLALAAEAYLQTGDVANAEAYFNQAAKANPDDPKVRTALALTQIAKGNTEAGFAQLETLAAADASTFADLALISARLRRNEPDAALKAIERLQTKQPDKALPYQLRGSVLAQRKDAVGARASFEKALAADPVYFPAVAGLAGLDVADKKPEDALKRFKALLEREPKNYRALLAVAELRQSTGAKPEEITALLAAAVKADPQEAAPRLLLVEHHLARRDAKSARAVAQDAVAAIPDNMPLLDALGRAFLATNDTQQAITAFRKAATAQPNRPEPQLRLADAYLTAKDYGSATQSLRRALEITPRLVAAQRGLVMVAVAEKKFDDALKTAQTIRKERPNEPIGWQLESDVYALQLEWKPAIAAMREALARGKSTDAAIRLYELYVAGGLTAEADRFAGTWQKDQPRDARFAFRLGAMMMYKNDYAAAESRFRQVLAVQPDNALALNNVAWLMVQQGKAGAVQIAERALQLVPEQTPVMDTLASALAAEGQLLKAIEWQRKAIAKSPNTPTYQLNLAKLLIKSGDKPAARAELEKLGQLGDKFGGQTEVADLLKTL